jgi:imidazolonepropionase
VRGTTNRASHVLYPIVNLALINIKQLVSVSSRGARAKAGMAMQDVGLIGDACVLVENGRIAWVGPMSELKMASIKEASILDCSGQVVMPGFVDSHTHALFAGSREDEFALRSSGMSYQEIAARGGGILSTVSSVRAASKKDLKRNARHYLSAMLRHGTTTVEIKSGYGLDVENETKMLEAIQELAEEEIITIVGTFLGAHAFPPEYADRKEKFVELICDKMIPYVAKKHLATFCDVFCEEGYFGLVDTARILTAAKDHNLAVKIHAEELTYLGGTELAAKIGATSADHLEHISDAGIGALREGNVVATLLPGVSFSLDHSYAPARKIIDAGGSVAIATDFNPGSCMSYSMPLMLTIACTHMRMSVEESITASTLNGAAALNLSHEVGSIEVGKKADMLVVDIPNYKFLPYHFGENHVEKVIKNGVVLEF